MDVGAMTTSTRRETLKALAGFALLGCSREPRRPETVETVETVAPGRARDDASSLDSLVDAMLGAEDPIVFAAGALRSGSSVETMLAVGFLAPILSGGDREDIHMMAALPCVQQLIGGAQTPVGVLWGIDRSRMWCGRERVSDERPSRATQGALRSAIVRGEPDAARGLAARRIEDGARAADVMDRLLEDACVARRDPHGVIFAAQAARMLDGPAAERLADVVGSVAYNLARREARAINAPPLRTEPEGDVTAEEIAAALRIDPSAPLPGVAENEVLGALAILAAEMCLADPVPTGDGLHRVTLLDALVFAHARLDGDRRDAALGSAVVWLASDYGTLVGADAVPLPAIEPSSERYRTGERLSAAETCARALGTDVARLRASARSYVLEHAESAHDYKLWSAAEHVADAIPARLRHRWLAACTSTFFFRHDSEWVRAREARRLLAGS